MTVTRELAYAKINLYLDVIGKRDDGFHNIKTVMHSVSLFDIVTVSVVPSHNMNVSLSIDGDSNIPSDGRNLACRAAELFYNKLGKKAEVKIKLVKNIPIAAGLAGGSSDAAAVLRALNRLYRKPFTLKALANMASELGSDVPYCVFGKTALCEGRGEKITQIHLPAKFNAVIANTDEGVSTPSAYAELDSIYSDFDGSIKTGGDECCEKILSELEEGRIPSCGMFNIFEEVILRKCKKAAAAKEKLQSLGAVKVMMSGSGPSVFGIFENEKAAENAKQKIEELGFRTSCVTSV